MTKSVTDKIT